MLHIVGTDGGESSLEHKPFREAQHLSSRSIGDVCAPACHTAWRCVQEADGSPCTSLMLEELLGCFCDTLCPHQTAATGLTEV